LTVKVCPGRDAGTSDWVKLLFLTCAKGVTSCSKHKFCETSRLDGIWGKGDTMEFHHPHFGSCLREEFRDLPTLHAVARVEPTRLHSFSNQNHDRLTICHIAVEFGDKSNKDHVHWEWTGRKSTEMVDGSLNGETGRIDLQKVQQD